MPEKPLVFVDSIDKSFNGQNALADISLSIYKGQITGLIGPDGAGKTTLMRIIAGLMKADKGNITFSEKKTSQRMPLIGYMPQQFGLYEDLTVIENLRLYAALRGIPRKEYPLHFKNVLTFAGLLPFQQRLSGQLSGGMKQKLALACALLGEPQLLLLDEPSVGVDPLSRQELWRSVQTLCSKGIAVLWSTAYLDEAEKSDRVLLLHQGKMLYHGTPKAFITPVKQRVFEWLAPNKDTAREQGLGLLKNPAILDIITKNNTVRIIIKKNTQAPSHFSPTEAHFEEALIDKLTDKALSPSILSAAYTQKIQQDKPVIKALHLSKQFGHFWAVTDQSFEIRQGEIFGLLGPNGAGKSTIFKMLCGLLKPSAGEAVVMGLDLKKAPSEARNKIGYMAQKFSLYGHLTVEQNLQFFARIYGLPLAAQCIQVQQMIEIFSLTPYLKHNANTLPLGFKQRLALASALIHQPDILFLDEPTSGVDPLTRREFWSHINGLVKKGVSIMITTHFMDEAEYCDRIALIYRGKTIASGSPFELKNKVRGDNKTLEQAFIQSIQEEEVSVEASSN